ncbi:MAG: DUF3604 domain-containing protein [Fuerstiella sp.]|nr:DUF3604 domain-containing protein [Fuerstiella sp.]
MLRIRFVHRFNLPMCAALVAGLSIGHATGATEDFVMNEDQSAYQSHPGAVVTSTGSMWVAWHTYSAGHDRIDVRQFSADGTSQPVTTISNNEEIAGPPTVVAGRHGSVCVIWSARSDAGWQIRAREYRNEKWKSTVNLSATESDAIYPTAATTHDGRVMATWSQKTSEGFRIVARVFDKGVWSTSLKVSDGKSDAYRSTVVTDERGTASVFWDAYEDGIYVIKSRSLLPKPGPVQQVSPAGRHCLKPTAIANSDGLCVAWLSKQDVIGGPGVISQWHILQAAVRVGGAWQLVTDSDGDPTAAELTHGLMGQIEPRVVATGGYLGQRTQPMLLRNGDDIWLMWERKSNHKGSTPNVVGELVGRRLHSGRWEKPVLLHHGLVDYHLPHSDEVTDGRFRVLASRLPRNSRRIYECLNLNLTDASEFQQEKWLGWEPVDLPIREELTPRQNITIAGKSYQLFWADMHCHSGLTCDAEGEPDELMHYARDRAKLDVVVFTNNDFLYDAPLTGYEYALSNDFARFYARPDFLALPGYEWTSRIPGRAGARDDDPGNWTPPYQNRSFPNHRSVVYPPTGGPIIRFPEVGNDINRLNAAVEKAGGLTFTQHDNFKVSGHAVEVGMELTSGWRNYIARVPKLFHEPLNNGARMGFVACGDSHRRAPGLSGALTGIYAEELTATAIFDALWQRRCFATNGSRILIDSRANDVFMGDEVTVSESQVSLTLAAVGTRPITSATLIRNGVELHRVSGSDDRDFSVEFTDTDVPTGTHWYYWRVTQERDAPVLPGNLMAAHGHVAWSTPVWVTAKQGDPIE